MNCENISFLTLAASNTVVLFSFLNGTFCSLKYENGQNMGSGKYRLSLEFMAEKLEKNIKETSLISKTNFCTNTEHR